MSLSHAALVPVIEPHVRFPCSTLKAMAEVLLAQAMVVDHAVPLLVQHVVSPNRPSQNPDSPSYPHIPKIFYLSTECSFDLKA